MIKTVIYLIALMVHHNHIRPTEAVIYTYEDVELRRLFPNEFPQDSVRKTGHIDSELLGRYAEIRHYFLHPMSKLNSHFEELACYDDGGKRTCKMDPHRFTSEENAYFLSQKKQSHLDSRRVYCIFLLCFTRDELEKVVMEF